MGEIADDHADGTCCSDCGQYFKGDKPDECFTHGYPVLCWACWREWTKQEKQSAGVQRSLRQTL